MKKVLYYSLVDWDWIKQRPQFLALGLAESGFNIRVIYLYQYRRKNLKKVDPGNVLLRPIFRIPPLGHKFPLINKMNRWIVRQKIAREINVFQPDLLWLTHPSQLADIPDTFTGEILYDCMDDYDVLGTPTNKLESARKQEQLLCDRADIILVSSSLLQRKICSRNPDKASSIHLVRNGCVGELYNRTTHNHGSKIYAGYVGTIAEWFDFKLIMESLERVPELEYFLIGPMGIKEPPAHERIHYIGTIAHDNLFDAIREMDCMVMPFQLVDIVLSVDPVKLYEYISWQKNIIAVDYREIDRFSDFVWTYTSVEDYCSILIKIGQLQTASYSEEEARCFLSDNSWKKRLEFIQQLLYQQKD